MHSYTSVAVDITLLSLTPFIPSGKDRQLVVAASCVRVQMHTTQLEATDYATVNFCCIQVLHQLSSHNNKQLATGWHMCVHRGLYVSIALFVAARVVGLPQSTSNNDVFSPAEYLSSMPVAAPHGLVGAIAGFTANMGAGTLLMHSSARPCKTRACVVCISCTCLLADPERSMYFARAANLGTLGCAPQGSRGWSGCIHY